MSIVSAAASPTSTATLRSVEAALEQRQRMADRIGDRLCGSVGFTFSDESLPAVRGRSQVAVRRKPKSVTGRSHLEIARAYLAKGTRGHPGSAASVEGEEDQPRYTDAQIQNLGEEGKALKKPVGGYDYPIADGRDVSNAVKAFGRAKPSERAGVRAWIVKRARILAIEGRLPESWSVKSPTPAAVGTESGS